MLKHWFITNTDGGINLYQVIPYILLFNKYKYIKKKVFESTFQIQLLCKYTFRLFAHDIFRQLDTKFAHDNFDNFVGNDMS